MSMEIDHFDPTIRGRARHRYSNLFLATRFCNSRKHGNWPSAEAKAAGVRFLDCCAEQDYGEHLFEDQKTHFVVGVTPAGKYHVRMLDLNAPFLVAERKERSEIHEILYEGHKLVKQTAAAMRAFWGNARTAEALDPADCTASLSPAKLAFSRPHELSRWVRFRSNGRPSLRRQLPTPNRAFPLQMLCSASAGVRSHSKIGCRLIPLTFAGYLSGFSRFPSCGWVSTGFGQFDFRRTS